MIMNYVYFKKNEISKVLSQDEVKKIIEKYNYNILKVAYSLYDQSNNVPFEPDDITYPESIPKIGKVYQESYEGYQKTYYGVIGFVKSENTRIDKLGIYVETMILSYRSKYEDFTLIHIYTPLMEFAYKIRDNGFKVFNKFPTKITSKLEKWILDKPLNP